MTLQANDIFIPNAQNVRAILTTRWDARSYRPLTVREIQGYYFESSLDTDADAWQLEIGDPDGSLISTLDRDNEVRVQIFGVGRAVNYIATGMADEISYAVDDGVLSLNGRDMSAIAVDSTALPQEFRNSLAHKIVEKQARALGMRGNFDLAKVRTPKRQYTDGSETYWEFWYRLYRKEKMWLWCDARGALHADKLNYHGQATYYFGVPPKSEKKNLWARWQPVEQVQIRKSAVKRIGEMVVYGHTGDNGFRVTVPDPTMRHWVKRPRKIMIDKNAFTRKSAKRTAYEEIFEGKVGEIEVTINVSDPGFQIFQNNLAMLNIPERNISGEFFVVGTRNRCDSSGFYQEIRLRERLYAVSRRVPTDPKLADDPKQAVVTASSTQLSVRWANYFMAAAKKWHGPWDYALFLATLLAICDQETGGEFINERANGGPGEDHVEWYPWKPEAKANHLDVSSKGHTLEQWKTIFANEPGLYTSSTFAVGPMQLYSQGFKYDADNMQQAGFHDQWRGGRWNPEFNIMAGAHALREKLQASVGDTGNQDDLWIGVAWYGHNSPAPAKIVSPYSVSVKNKVFNDPGYLQIVKTALEEGRTIAKPDAGDITGITDKVTAIEIATKLLVYIKRGELQGHPDIIASAAGKPVRNQAGQSVYIDHKVLAAILNACEMRFGGPKKYIGISALCSDHSVSTTRGARSAHPDGRAVDINYIDGIKVDTNTALTKRVVITFDTAARNNFSYRPDQLITGGYGNHRDADVTKLTLPDGWADHQYDSGVMQQHTNHVHIGY